MDNTKLTIWRGLKGVLINEVRIDCVEVLAFDGYSRSYLEQRIGDIVENEATSQILVEPDLRYNDASEVSEFVFSFIKMPDRRWLIPNNASALSTRG